MKEVTVNSEWVRRKNIYPQKIKIRRVKKIMEESVFGVKSWMIIVSWAIKPERTNNMIVKQLKIKSLPVVVAELLLTNVKRSDNCSEVLNIFIHNSTMLKKPLDNGSKLFTIFFYNSTLLKNHSTFDHNIPTFVWWLTFKLNYLTSIISNSTVCLALQQKKKKIK